MIATSAALVLLCCQQNTAEFTGKVDVDVREDDVALRRLRLGVEGEFGEGSNYVFSINNDVENKGSSLHEMMIWFDHPWGITEIGYFKEPFGLENSHSSHEVNFLERSDATLLAADHNIGFANYIEIDDMTHLSWGVYRNSVSARYVNLLVAQEDISNFWHVGASIGGRESDRFFRGDEIMLFDVETLYQDGPFSFQAEAQLLEIDDTESMSITAQASYVLHGEARIYDIAKSKFSFPEEAGDIEVALRATRVDMTEYQPAMSVINDYNFALNYYLDDSSKLQLEVERGSDGLSDEQTTVALRYHFRW
jgi:phosphate-selective porin